MGNERQQLDSKEDVKATLEKIEQWEPLIQKAARRFDIRPEDIRAIIGVESHGRPTARAGGAKSASGLMQVTAGTWGEMQRKHKDLAPYDFASNWNKPEINILFGAATLASKRESMRRFGLDVDGPQFAKLAITAYNGGEGVVKMAYEHAKAAGAKNPEEACLQFEHLAYAVEHTKDKIWQYYMPGHGGAKRNKSGTMAEAVKLKTQEIMKYPNRVGAYLAEQKADTRTTTTETKSDTTQTTETRSGDVTVSVDELTPVLPGHLIAKSVGEGGNNHEGDVGTVQKALQEHGHSPGAIDHRIGPRTIGAIRAFQAGFLKRPDGLVEVGRATEKHLMQPGTSTKTEDEKEKKETEPTTEQSETSSQGSAQMSRLVATASSVRGKRPLGKCYAAVKVHINNAGGYGNFKNIYTDRRFQPQGEAHDFADIVNRAPAKFGLERLSITNPYDAPTGSLVVVAAGSPGTRHKTAGDITVKGPNDEFFNDGSMGYKGRVAWPPKRGGVLGVYKPK
jgi:peptidoglycan hydrolase-like protein with peptidoglycan-binding domain